jgi:hypothetical protein
MRCANCWKKVDTLNYCQVCHMHRELSTLESDVATANRVVRRIASFHGFITAMPLGADISSIVTVALPVSVATVDQWCQRR